MFGPVSCCARMSFKMLRKTSNMYRVSYSIPRIAARSPFHSGSFVCEKKKSEEAKMEQLVVVKEQAFQSPMKKNKSSFLNVVDSYTENIKGFRGHLEFVHAALRNMDEYNVQYDLETYKKLMNVFPKGKYIARNMIQAEFFHFYKHQECGIELLDKMEWNGVLPDKEMKEIVLNVFGNRSVVYKKYCRMLYWMPKLKNLNPYEVPDPLPSDIELLAELAMKKMSVDLKTKISHFKTADLENVLDDTWIVSAQSPVQQDILKKHPVEKPVYVEGPYLIWLKRVSLSYFILKADPPNRPFVEFDNDDVSNLSLYMFGEPKPKHLTVTPNTIHEQEDGTIFAACATGTSSKDSVLSWVRFLQQSNPILENVPILFKLKSITTAVTTLNIGGRTFEGESSEADDKQKTDEKESKNAGDESSNVEKQQQQQS